MKDNILPISLRGPDDILREISERFKTRRLQLGLTREGLALRASINSSSLKRFETTGQISFDSLLKISLVLGCLSDFDYIAQSREILRLDDILKKEKIPKKGKIK